MLRRKQFIVNSLLMAGFCIMVKVSRKNDFDRQSNISFSLWHTLSTFQLILGCLLSVEFRGRFDTPVFQSDGNIALTDFQRPKLPGFFVMQVDDANDASSRLKELCTHFKIILKSIILRQNWFLDVTLSWANVVQYATKTLHQIFKLKKICFFRSIFLKLDASTYNIYHCTYKVKKCHGWQHWIIAILPTLVSATTAHYSISINVQ